MSTKTKMPKPLFDAAVLADGSKIVSGKYIGNCPDCNLILASFDVKDKSAACPGCGKRSLAKTLVKHEFVVDPGLARLALSDNSNNIVVVTVKGR